MEILKDGDSEKGKVLYIYIYHCERPAVAEWLASSRSEREVAGSSRDCIHHRV